MVQAKKKPNRKDKKQNEAQEIYSIRSAVSQLAQSITDTRTALIAAEKHKLFSDLPLSFRTRAGLETGHFVEMTEIQKLSLPAALCGRDILGAAETGSGKTLSFLIPILEKLNTEGWTVNDGLGAVILAPTRELAIQIFQVLRKIGIKHTLSAGLVIGGKDLNTERQVIVRMNILVATPGRLLQHMDQSVGFEWGNLQVLVLDEADRILDLGFAKTVNAIIRALPRQRQTLLFSATQTGSVEDLARLSLIDPISISTNSLRNSVDSNAPQKLVTPSSLVQYYLSSTLPDKIDHLWSFVKSHLQSKMIVFVSSCKQVRFIHETFCRLQPGIPLLHLHGRQKQPKRMTVFADFCRKKSAVLFATDIAARGLDFPAVDWVVQVDCPEDVETYVHRVGRTARYDAPGSSLLFLLSSELKEMLNILEKENSFRIARFSSKLNDQSEAIPKVSIRSKLQALCSQDPEIKYIGQKSLISYIRSIYLQKNKRIFSVDGLPIEEFAVAIGLPGAPKLRFIDRQSAAKNACRQTIEVSDSDEAGHEIVSHAAKPKRAIDKMFLKKNTNVLSEHYQKLHDNSDPSDDDDLLVVKRRDAQIDMDEFKLPISKTLSRRDLLKTKKKYRLKSQADRSVKLVFDDETGESKEALPFQPEVEFDRSQIPDLSKAYIQESGQALVNADVLDKQREKQVRREKKLEKKRKAKDVLLGQMNDSKQVKIGEIDE